MNKEDSTFNNFMRLFRFLPNKAYLFVGVFFLVTIAYIDVYTSIIIKDLVNSAETNDYNLFYTSLYMIIGIQVIYMVFTFLKTRIFGSYSEKGLKSLRENLAKKYNQLEIESLSDKHSGDYISRATNDVNKIKNFITTSLPYLISIPITGIGAVVVLFSISWKLTLVSFTAIPILILVVGVLSKPLGSISKRLQEKLGLVNSLVQDYIKGIEVSKAYTLEKVLGKKYDEAVEESVTCGKQLARKRATLQSFSELISITPFFITFFLGGYFVIENQMSIGGLLAFINLLNFVTQPFTALPRLVAQTKIDLAGSVRIFEVLSFDEERQDGESYNINGAKNIIEFKDVDFSYPNKNDLVLNKLNLKIKKGESVALVGPSGGGKSTIIKMLLGYFNNYEGKINISDHELRKWNLKGLRDQIGLVSQDTFLFPESIEENIRYGDAKSKDKDLDVKKAAKLANADDFIVSFKNGYQTQIGQLGNKLSGGQKQRLSIARAIVKDAPILLLDEATSALDNESESLVQEALERLMDHKTSIVIAHRLSTIKNVDRILVVDGGQIVETGSHNELINKNGIYKDLYTKQMKFDENDEEEVA